MAWELSPYYPWIWGSHRALDGVRLHSENFLKAKKKIFRQSTKEQIAQLQSYLVTQVMETCKPKSKISVAPPYLSEVGQTQSDTLRERKVWVTLERSRP